MGQWPATALDDFLEVRASLNYDRDSNHIIEIIKLQNLNSGVSCPLAELGYKPDKIRRFQVNLAHLVSSMDKYHIMHFIYEGSRHSASTVKNLLVGLTNSAIEPGTLIWDRSNIFRIKVLLGPFLDLAPTETRNIQIFIAELNPFTSGGFA
jgi:hypothetical protein